jgi:hypothetical protein
MNTAKQARDDFQLKGWKKLTPKPTKDKKDELVAEYTSKFEDEKKNYHTSCRSEYKTLILQAERDRKDSDALRLEYKNWFQEELPKPLPAEEDPKKK